MAQLHLKGDPDILIELRRHARARRLSLRVSQLDGRVTLTLPRAASQVEAQGFARQKEGWIRRQLDNRITEIVPYVGGTVLLEGRDVPIVTGSGRAACFGAGQLMVPGDASRVPVRIAAYLKGLARQRLSSASAVYAGMLGVEVHRMTLRDTRSRWGSCTTGGHLMFSWRLIMAPADVLDYVAAHEVAHLVEMNHSPAYWSVVARISPEYAAPRRWLRRNGAILHAYRFAQLTQGGGRDQVVPC